MLYLKSKESNVWSLFVSGCLGVDALVVDYCTDFLKTDVPTYVLFIFIIFALALFISRRKLLVVEYIRIYEFSLEAGVRLKAGSAVFLKSAKSDGKEQLRPLRFIRLYGNEKCAGN